MTQPHDPSQPQWQPTYAPAPPPQRGWVSRHKGLTVVLASGALLLACCGGGAAVLAEGGSSTSPTTEAGSSTSRPTDGRSTTPTKGSKKKAAATKASGPGIGDAARDGKFEFVVESVEPGVASVGDDFLQEKAQGQFVLVEISVTNIGEEAQTMFDSEQKIIDTQGRTFEANSSAAISIEGNSDVWLTDVNPGNTATGTMVFDMPKGSTPASIELHDSMFSDGVTVSLR